MKRIEVKRLVDRHTSLKHHECTLQVSSKDWNACAHASDGYTPFVSWEFLHALEESGSVVG